MLAVYKEISKKYNISLLEIKPNQIKLLNSIIRKLDTKKNRYIIFCDDFSFTSLDENFVLFKNLIDGTVSRKKNILYYVTSNYRSMIKESVSNKENTLKKQEIDEDEAALSDRFGLWLGFERFDKKKYLEVVNKYRKIYKIKISKNKLNEKAIQWSILRGSFSGREALNFIKNLKNNNI